MANKREAPKNKNALQNIIEPKLSLYSRWVFLLPVLLYASTAFFGYNLDDELVTINHRLTSKGLAAIPEIFTSPYYQDEYGYAYEYRPIVLLSFAVEHQFFGDNATVSHIVNILLYAACVWLLFKVLIRLFPSVPLIVPLSIALLYAAHTSHTEVVASIKNRDELLALVFSLVTCVIVDIGTKRKWIWALVPFTFSLALLSKATALCFAAIIPIAFTMVRGMAFNELALIIGLLNFPAFVFLNMQSGFERLLVVLAIFAAVVVFYVMLNFTTVVLFWREVFARFSLWFKEDNVQGDTTVKTGLQGFLPNATFFQIKYVLTALLLAGFSSWTIYMGYGVVSSLFIVSLFSVTVLRDNALRWWANTILTVSFVQWGFLLHVNTWEISIYEKVVTFYLAFVLVFGSRTLFLPTLLLFGVYAARVYSMGFNLADLASVFAGLVMFRNKYLRFIGVALVVFVVYTETTSSASVVNILINLINPALFIILILLLQLKLSTEYMMRAIGPIVIVMCVWFAFSGENSMYGDFVSTVKNVSNNVNPQLIEKQDRPLHYTEQVVMPDDPVSMRMGTSLEILLHYLVKTVVPYPLSFYYGYRFITPMALTHPLALFSLALHLVIFIMALWLINRNRMISFGLLTYLVSIAVFSDYFQYVPGMVADRYLLVPTIGWSIVFVGVLLHFSKQPLNTKQFNWVALPPVKYAFATLFIVYSVLTFSRNLDWKDDLTLFRNDIRYVDQSAQAHNLLALHLMQHSAKEQDQTKQIQLAQEALGHFQKAQEIYPQFFNVAYDIGRVYSILGKPDSAIAAFEKAISIDTIFPDVYLKLADLYFQKQNFERSNMYLQDFIRKQPLDYTGYNKLSYNLFLMKRYDESLQVNREAIQRIPGVVDAYLNIARTFIEMKNNDSAYYYMRAADRLQPNNPQIQSALQQLKSSVIEPR